MSFRFFKAISFSIAFAALAIAASPVQAAEKTLQQGEACLKKFNIVLPTPEVYAAAERARKRYAKKKKSNTSTTQDTGSQDSGATTGKFEVVTIDHANNVGGQGDQNDSPAKDDNSSSSGNPMLVIDQSALDNVELSPSFLDQLNEENARKAAQKTSAELKKAKQEAYQRMIGMACYTLSDGIVGHLLKTASGEHGSVRAPKVTLAEGFFEGIVAEPGLVGLDGAEEVITDILTDEAMTLWFLAIEKGAVIDMPSAEDLVRYAELHIENALAYPDDAVSLRFRVWEWLDETILTRSKNELEEHELRFINALEEYIRQTNVRIANEALEAYQQREFEAAQKRSQLGSLYYMGQEPWDVQEEMKASMTLGGMAAGMASSVIGAEKWNAQRRAKELAQLDQSESIKKQKSLAIMQDFASDHPELQNVNGWVKGTVKGDKGWYTRKMAKIGKARQKVIVRVGQKMGKLGYKVGSKLAGKAAMKLVMAGARIARIGAMKAVNVVPVFGQVIDGIYTSVEQFIAVTKIANIEKKLKTAAERAARADWNPYSLYKVSKGGANVGRNLVAMYYFRATSSESPRKAKKKLPSCAACFYSQTDFKSEKSDDYFCTSGRIDNMSQFEDDRGVTVKFNNKIRSVSFLRNDGKCQAPEVYLYEDSNFTNDKVRLKGDTPDLSKLRRGKKGDWDKVTSSVVYKQAGVASCEVCVYKKRNYKGENMCFEGRAPDLRQYDMNNAISSIKFNTEGCPDAKLWAYHKTNFERHKSGIDLKGISKIRNNEEQWVKVYDKDVPNVGVEHGWEDRFSSLIFSPDGTNDLAGPQIPENACMVCMFEIKDYEGNYVCLQQGEKIDNLNDHMLGDERMRFANLISSVKFITGACKPGTEFQLELYNRARLTGDSIVLKEDAPSLPKFDNATTSARLTDKSKVCRVCLHDAKNYQGDQRCFPVGTTNLTDHKFNNKPSSVSFQKEGCKNPDTFGVTLYENIKAMGSSGISLNYTRTKVTDEFKFGHVNILKDTPDLSKLNRGRRSNWNKQVSKIIVKDDMALENENLKAVENGCGVCFYDGENHTGSAYCLSAGQSLGELDDLYTGANYISMKTKVSSVKFFGKTCGKGSLLEASLYSGADLKGDREVVVRDLKKLSHFDNKAKSIKVDLRSGKDVAKACEVCLHSEKGFQGDRQCFTKGVENLKTVTFNNEPSSVSLFTDGCKKKVAVKLMENTWGDKQYTYLDKAVPDLSKLKRGKKANWDNVVSSFRFGFNTYKDMNASVHQNATVKNGCGVCLYANDNHRGDEYCVEANGSAADLRTLNVDGRPLAFDNKASSVKFYGRKCPRGSRLEVELYNERDFKSQREVAVMDSRALGKFDNKTESIKVGLRAKADIANACQVCMHSEKNYTGDRKCFTNSVKNMNSVDFNNKLSSVAFNVAGCNKKVALKLFENDWTGKEFIYVGENVPDMSKIKRGKNDDWDDKVSGFRFNTDAYDQMVDVAAKADPANACRVCFHSEVNYRGSKRCFEKGAKSMGNFNNDAGSVGFETSGCKSPVAVQLFEDGNWAGDTSYIGSNIPDLRRVKRGTSGNWYRVMSSFRFGPGTHERMTAAKNAKANELRNACQVCFYTQENHRGEKRCFKSGVADMRKVNFNNKPASVVFETQGCSKKVALQMFEDADRTGDTGYLGNDVNSLKNVKRGNRGNWYRNMSSFRFGPNSYNRMKASR